MTQDQRSKYRHKDGWEGFLAIGLKNAAVTACTSVEGITKVAARQAFHVWGIEDKELIRIEGAESEMREDMVRIGMGVADLRYRAQYKEWFAKFAIDYNANALSPEQIVNLFNNAGFGVGIFEWRPERDGMYGLFRVKSVDGVPIQGGQWGQTP